ncbi:MAG TPA: dienelactone hydrolase family protein [Pseudolabrys sp.]|jgi:carboxymethylenebutenolidase|nr:dienelactone hydrolase family protein [Pseudolabrys sp.]
MDQQIINLYDRFTHGGMNRRDFLDRLAGLTGSTAAATALLPVLANDYARAATVAENDPRLVSERVTYDSPAGKISAYLTRGKNKGKRPAVIVIHENRGLNPHIMDVARRVALEGFLTLAPDLLSVSGGTPPTDDAARDLHAKSDQKKMYAAALAAIGFIKGHVESNGKVGAVGFCFGGGMVNRMAVGSPDLKAGVAYYGAQPAASDVPSVKAALLLHYAGLDERIDAGIPAYEAALKENKKRYTIYMYPNVNHGFNNDTGGPRYDKAAADLAWSRTIAFFKQELGEPPKAG